MEIDPKDKEILIREKYQGDEHAHGVTDDIARLAAGMPLAYVIGNIPFLGLTIGLESHPLIPRPETEWWTEELIKEINEKNTIIYDSVHPVRILDLCAGSGAIGLAILKHCPNAHVSFGEVSGQHAEQIARNLEANGLDANRAEIHAGDLFAPFVGKAFDVIATNPPYIPSERELSKSVADFEPKDALYAGLDGLALIGRIAAGAPQHLSSKGILWMECDTANVEAAKDIILANGFSNARIRTDQYGRPRLVVAHL